MIIKKPSTFRTFGCYMGQKQSVRVKRSALLPIIHWCLNDDWPCPRWMSQTQTGVKEYWENLFFKSHPALIYVSLLVRLVDEPGRFVTFSLLSWVQSLAPDMLLLTAELVNDLLTRLPRCVVPLISCFLELYTALSTIGWVISKRLYSRFLSKLKIMLNNWYDRY